MGTNQHDKSRLLDTTMDDLKHNTSIEQPDHSPARGSGRSLRPGVIEEEDDLDMDGNAIKNSKLSGG